MPEIGDGTPKLGLILISRHIRFDEVETSLSTEPDEPPTLPPVEPPVVPADVAFELLSADKLLAAAEE